MLEEEVDEWMGEQERKCRGYKSESGTCFRYRRWSTWSWRHSTSQLACCDYAVRVIIILLVNVLMMAAAGDVQMHAETEKEGGPLFFSCDPEKGKA